MFVFVRNKEEHESYCSVTETILINANCHKRYRDFLEPTLSFGITIGRKYGLSIKLSESNVSYEADRSVGFGCCMEPDDKPV